MSTSSIYQGQTPLTSGSLDLFLVEVLIVVVLCKLLSYILTFFKQPSVIAEVITGILLGPSVLGFIPNFTTDIFPTASLNIFNVVANVGLILFMFLVGLEVDPNLMRRNLRSSAVISVTAMLVPFALGVGASTYLYYELPMAPSATFASFLLFVGVAVSITAFPVLARILTNQGITHSKVGVVALSSAAVDDVTAWICLAVVVSVARSSGSLDALYTLLTLTGYALLMIVVVRPILVRLSKAVHARDTMKHEFVVLVLLLLFASALCTDVIGVHPIFGGFFMGVITPREHRFAVGMTERIEDLTMIILVPLYFTYSGLRTNLSTLNSWQAGIGILLVIGASMLGKIGGATVASRFLGNTWRESTTIGFLLNTKGLVELVALNVGLDIGVLSEQVFAIFVVMALWNTIITTPAVWLLWIRKEKRRDHMLRKSTDFSVLVCIPETRAGVSMVTVAGALAKAHSKGIGSPRKPRIHAIHLKEVSERPSTYFFALRLDKSDEVEFARQRASVLDVRFKATARASTNIAADLIKFSNSRVRDLVILGWNKSHLENITEGGRRTHQLMQHIHAPIGILIDNGHLRNRINLKRVMLVYSFQDFEKEAVKSALELARDPEIHLVIVVTRQEWLMRRSEEIPNVDGALFSTQAADSEGESDHNHTNRLAWHHYFDILLLLSLLVRLISKWLGFGPSDRQDNDPTKHQASSTASGPEGTEMQESKEQNDTGDTTNQDIEHDNAASFDELSVVDGEDPLQQSRRESSILSSDLGLASGSAGLAAATAVAAAENSSLFSTEQKRTEEQLMQTFEGVLTLVKRRNNISLIVSETESVLHEALQQEATNSYQLIIIGNERRWSRMNHPYLNLYRHHLHFRHQHDEDENRYLEEFGELVGHSNTSLFVVHPPLEQTTSSKQRRWFNFMRKTQPKEEEALDGAEEQEEDQSEKETSEAGVQGADAV